MADFAFTEILPLGPDNTPYRLIGTEGVETVETPLGTFLKVSPEATSRISSVPGTCSSCATSLMTRRQARTTGSWRSTC